MMSKGFLANARSRAMAELSNTSTHFRLNLQSNYDKHTERLERVKNDT